MSKKLTFDNLPAAVEKILELLTSGGTDHTALPELVQRMTLLEKKLDNLQKSVTPNRPTMDMHEVCRALKLRPKAVNELAMQGVLVSHSEDRKTLFYEDDVVKVFMTMPAWRAAMAKPKPVSSAPATEAIPDVHGRIDINTAAKILDRSTAAIYQLVSTQKVPHHKDGRKVYFDAEELHKWGQSHPARKRKIRTR